MRAIRLTVKNIGPVADATVEFNQPLILFFGAIRQGKTTFLNAVKWVFGGAFPGDIIRHGETEAHIRLDLDCGFIRRSFYRAKNGEIKARALEFHKDGMAVRDAVAEIRALLNPFLLDQNFLVEKSELERKKYFASMFAVDLEGLDREITKTEGDASAARERLKGYGDIDITPVEPPADLDELSSRRNALLSNHAVDLNTVRVELAKCRSGYAAEQIRIITLNHTIRNNNARVADAQKSKVAGEAEVNQLNRRLADMQSILASTALWLKDNKPQDELPLPAAPVTQDLEDELTTPADTAEVDVLISKCQADQVRFDQFIKNQNRAKERGAVEVSILALEKTTRELRSKKIARLKECGETSGIPGLTFDEAGNFSYEDTEAGMLSTSQLMRLSSQLSSLYPEGFGLELLDRGESLGQSIYTFVEQAKQQKKTILATIVGERPAQVPAEVGVFVVENGRVV